jgi:hypothetical protein
MNDSHGNVILIYGAFDREPPPSNKREQCRAIYIPNTTWTAGRNELSKAAYCLEQQRKKDFTYWIFSDDDIELDCRSYRRGMKKQRIEGWQTFSCWKIYFDFVAKALPSFKSPLLSAEFFKYEPYTLGDWYDAALNAMERDRIHLMLPYITKEPNGTSWWLSAMVQILVGRSCFPFTTLIFELASVNPAHSDYPRGLDTDEAKRLMFDNYGSYVPDMPAFPENTPIQSLIHYRQLSFVKAKKFVQKQMDSVGDYCDPLKQRWEDWLVSWGPTCSAFTDT